jgi:sigma-E factor negative regulatory protein RseB
MNSIRRQLASLARSGRVARGSVAALVCVLALPASAADREARAWLERMQESLATRNYEGQFVHMQAQRSAQMRIIHRVDKAGKVTERLVSLDGSGREYIGDESQVICYLPDRRQVLVQKRVNDTLIAAVPSYSEELETLYSIERGPATRALTRKTQVILIRPRDQFRYGYQLWLDYETAMPLKSQLYDPAGRVIERVQFSEINFRDRIPAEALKPAVTGEGYVWLKPDAQQPQLANRNVAPGWNAIRLPAGFRLTTYRVQFIAGSNAAVRHLVYSDGLATVSVFIEPRSAQTEAMHGFARVGSASAFSVALGGNQVTAVGEVPAKTVQTIAEGVTRAVEPATAPAPDQRAAPAPDPRGPAPAPQQR